MYGLADTALLGSASAVKHCPWISSRARFASVGSRPKAVKRFQAGVALMY